MSRVTPAFWSGRRVLLTGHTGFKGGWLATWLLELGARVTGYALPPATTPALFDLAGLAAKLDSRLGDVRDAGPVAEAVAAARPSVVFHLAAQPIVSRSYREPAATVTTNVTGTVNVLEAVRQSPGVEAVVVITSDKCYEPLAAPRGLHEDDRLGGADPYSASKAAAELVVKAYRQSFFASGRPAVATARAGKVIGGGDWAEDRIVPDAVRAFSCGQPLRVRRPAAVRPWQHVLEPLAGYLALAERLAGPQGAAWAEAWNFGPRDADAVPVATLVALLAAQWDGARTEAAVTPGELETEVLRLDWSKARDRLGWRPVLGLEEGVALTAAWYRTAAARPADAYELTAAQVRSYERRRHDGADA